MVLDFFNHVIPGNFVPALKQSGADPELIRKLKPLISGPQFKDIDGRIKVLLENGVDLQLVCLGEAMLWRGVHSEKEAMNLTRVANDGVALFVEKGKKYFVGAATVPVPREDSLDELDRCVKDLGLKAVQIFSNVNGFPLDHPDFRQFFARASKLDIPILIHPQTADYYQWIEEYRLYAVIGWPFDTSLAMARLVYGGVLKQYPNLKIIAHHHGAMIPLFPGRFSTIYEMRHLFPESKFVELDEPPLESFKKFYGDTASFGSQEPILFAYRFFGRDHMVFASDYPFGPDQGRRHMTETLKAVRALPIPDEDKERILDTNARSLLKLN